MPSNLSLSHIKFRHLVLLSHLVEFGNLHKVAEHLSISQPAASTMLKEFERQIGLTLFLRTNQGVVPTAAALALVTRARTILNEFDTLTHEIKHQTRNSAGLLRVGVVPQVLSAYLPDAIERFREQDEALISIHEGTARHLLAQLFDGKLDCVIGRLAGASLPTEQSAMDLKFVPLYSERICIVEGTRTRLRERPSYAALAHRDWVLTQPTSSLRQQLVDFFFRRGLVLPDPVIETSNYFQSLAVLAGSDLCSVIPYSAVDVHIKLGHLRIVDIPEDLSPMPVSFITRSSSSANVSVDRFREIFIEITS